MIAWSLDAGNLRTVDWDGPYNFSLLDTQANEVKGALSRAASPTCNVSSLMFKLWLLYDA